jgi:serine/threonine-protein kinase
MPDRGASDGESCFLVLEFIRGRTVRQVIEKGGPIPPARAARIARQLALALGAAHKKGIVHRDVKPRNVMVLDGEGGEEIVKLIDFGLAKVPVADLSASARDADNERRSLTAAGVVMGTVAYMAPETALGMRAVGPKADLYSLGVIFYEMLTGKHPFDAEDPALLFAQHKNKQPPPFRERNPQVIVPAPLEAVVQRLLAKDPDDRYADADALVEAIDAATRPPMAFGINTSSAAVSLGGEHTPLPAAASPGLSSLSRSSKLIAGTGVVLGLAFVVAVILIATRGGDARTASSSSAGAGVGASVAASSGTPAHRGSSSVVGAAPADARSRLHAAVTTKDVKEARLAVLDLVERDAGAFRDRDIQKEAALACELAAADGTGDEVVDAITKVEGGLDILYELVARDASVQGAAPSRAAAVRARSILGRPDVYERTSPALKAALELRAAPCQKRVFMLPRMVAEGDERALAILGAMRPPTCGPEGSGCCQKSPELDQAITDLSARLQKGQ